MNLLIKYLCCIAPQRWDLLLNNISTSCSLGRSLPEVEWSDKGVSFQGWMGFVSILCCFFFILMQGFVAWMIDIPSGNIESDRVKAFGGNPLVVVSLTLSVVIFNHQQAGSATVVLYRGHQPWRWIKCPFSLILIHFYCPHYRPTVLLWGCKI